MQSFADEWKGPLRGMSPAQIDRFLADLRPGEAEELVHRWHLWARPSQLPPPGDWAAAAAEALDSRWAAQTGRRADDITALLRSG